MAEHNNEASTTELMSSHDVARTVARIAHQIIEKTALTELDHSQRPQVCLLGIPSGGVPLAERLAAKIKEFSQVDVPVGILDTTLYRDDLHHRSHRALEPTSIPESGIDGITVILIDDVLFSGRTIRAALDALRDIGRPAAIQLAVLVDRGHRELPIRADYVGKNIPTSLAEQVTVLMHSLDGRDGVTITRAA